MQLPYRLLVAAGVVGLAAGTAWGQQGATSERTTDQGTVQSQQGQASQGEHRFRSEHTAATRGSGGSLQSAGLFKVSDLMGLDVRGSGGEDLGEIKDLTIDPKTGKIRYGAVSMGGFLGIGDKLVAVPWEAFRIQLSGTGEDAELVASLNIDKNRMKMAQGFDENRWPASADQMWQTGTETGSDVDVDVEHSDRSKDLDQSRTGTRSQPESRSAPQNR